MRLPLGGRAAGGKALANPTSLLLLHDPMQPSTHPDSEPPSDCWSGKIRGIYHKQLPHWVVDYGCYALTFHCKDSLPVAAMRKLSEIVESESEVNSTDEEFMEQSRRRFKMMEHYLDQSYGSCPLREPSLRFQLGRFLEAYDADFRFRHWAVMPNHLHLLTEPVRFASADAFQRAVKIFKMRSTVMVNRHVGDSGRLWMKDGYDRWVRDADEYGRWIRYLRNNPVKAKLCTNPEDWVGLR
jgi:REP element-mobilizing transposase RayT